MAESPKLTISELAELLSPATKGSTNNGDAEHYISLSQDDHSKGFYENVNNDYNNGNQPPATPNGTYSESLTRLQNGYLKTITSLEAQIFSLKHALAAAQSRQDFALDATTTARLDALESQNDILHLELQAARSKPIDKAAELHNLQQVLAKKNTTIKEKNSKILHLEQTNRRLEAEAKEVTKKMRDVEMVKAREEKMRRADEKRKTEANGGWPMGEKSMKEKQPPQKKRKRIEFVRGGEGNLANPWVID